jgi:hypothetical protein
MKYLLLALILGCTTFAKAQKIWDQEAHTKLCDKQLSEVLARTYELIIEGKLSAYWNDSFATKMTKYELEIRFSDEYITNIGLKEGDFWTIDSIIIVPKNPRESIVGFSLIQNNTASTSESSTYVTLGINLLYPLKLAGIDLGINPLCNIKWEDLKKALSSQELEYLQAYIQTAKIFGNFEFIHFNNDTLGYLSDNLSWRLANRAPYHLRLTKPWQKAVANAGFNQYINAAYSASNSGKRSYKDVNLAKPFKNLENDLMTYYNVEIHNSANPDDPYDLKDTSVAVSFNWETEQIALFKTPKGEFVMGFKATKLWFYMKLEDLLPYLPKEVLPSLELLKKEL